MREKLKYLLAVLTNNYILEKKIVIIRIFKTFPFILLRREKGLFWQIPKIRFSKCKFPEDEMPVKLRKKIIAKRIKLITTKDSSRRCRVCGCTHFNPCIDEEGPCYWIEEDLCSSCATEEQLNMALIQRKEILGMLKDPGDE